MTTSQQEAADTEIQWLIQNLDKSAASVDGVVPPQDVDIDLVEATLRYLVSQGGNLTRCQAVMGSIMDDNLELFDLLWRVDTDIVKQCDDHGTTALMLAAYQATLNALDPYYDYSISALCWQILYRGADKNHQNNDGDTAKDIVETTVNENCYTNEEFRRALSKLEPLLRMLS